MHAFRDPVYLFLLLGDHFRTAVISSATGGFADTSWLQFPGLSSPGR